MLLASSFFASGAAAQSDDRFGDPEVLQTCSLYSIVLSTGGDTLIDAATELNELADPNPPGVSEALETLIEAESGPGVDTVAAFDSLDAYYGPICGAIDQCPIVEGLQSVSQEVSAEAAALLRDLNRPNPPGIGIALQGLIDPETDPDDYAQFRIQAAEYFAAACDDDAVYSGADDAPDDEAGADDDAVAGSTDSTEETEDDAPVSATGSADDDAAYDRTATGSAGEGALPSTGFGTVGLFLAFAAFVAFTVGAAFVAFADRSVV